MNYTRGGNFMVKVTGEPCGRDTRIDILRQLAVLSFRTHAILQLCQFILTEKCVLSNGFFFTFPSELTVFLAHGKILFRRYEGRLLRFPFLFLSDGCLPSARNIFLIIVVEYIQFQKSSLSCIQRENLYSLLTKILQNLLPLCVPSKPSFSSNIVFLILERR